MSNLSNLNECKKCERLTCYPIPARGPITPNNIMIVGEAPGADEVTQRKPFVGSAGKTAWGLLNHAGINFDSCYVTNTIKCRPPNNRTPESEEIFNCLKYLTDEIFLLQPKVIIAFGDVASIILTDKPLKDWRGSIVPCCIKGLEHIPVLLTYHPSFIMQWGRRHYSTVVSDLEKAKNPILPVVQDYVVNATLEEGNYFLSQWSKSSENVHLNVETKPISVDIETIGEHKDDALDPYECIIVGISFCGEKGKAFNFSFGTDAKAKWALVKAFCEDPDQKLIMQNNIFDRGCLQVQKGIKIEKIFFDTQDAMHTINPDSEKKLHYLRSIYTNVPPYKQLYKPGYMKGFNNTPIEKVGWLACADTDTTLQVYQNQLSYLTPELKGVLQCTLDEDDLALKMKMRGIQIDKTRIANKYIDLQPEVAQIESDFYTDHGIMVSSNKQVSNYLFNVKNMPIPPRTKKGKSGVWSVDEKVLTALLKRVHVEENRKIIESIMHYRKRAKVLSTYIIGIYKQLKDDDKVHPDWRPTGTDTGRWSCQKPPMQVIPKDLRPIYCASPGNKLVWGDYKSLELVIAAILADDIDMYDFIVNGGDFHGQMMTEMQKIHPTTRVQAKAINFGTIYGMSPRTLALEHGISTNLAESWQSIVTGNYPKLKIAADKRIKDYEKNGYLSTPFHRRKYPENINQALNFPSQSVAVEVAKRALLKLEEQMWNPILNVHDENVCDVPMIADEDRFVEIMETSCTELAPRFPIEKGSGLNWTIDFKDEENKCTE